MKNTEQNVVSLAEFKKVRDQFGVSDAEEFIKYQQPRRPPKIPHLWPPENPAL